MLRLSDAKWGGPPGCSAQCPRPTPSSAFHACAEPDQGVRRGRGRPPHLSVVVLCLGLSALVLHGEPADTIYTARYVVTMNAQRDLIDDGAVAVRGQRIVGVGKRVDIEKQFKARQHVNRPDAIFMPGLINTHTHAAMSLFRGIADDMVVQDWLNKFIFPAEAKNVTADFVVWGTRLACLEMMLS